MKTLEESFKDKLTNNLRKLFSKPHYEEKYKQYKETQDKIIQEMKQEKRQQERLEQERLKNDQIIKENNELKEILNIKKIIQENAELKKMLNNYKEQYNLVVNLYNENTKIIYQLKYIFKIFFVSHKRSYNSPIQNYIGTKNYYETSYYDKVPWCISDYTQELINLNLPHISKIYHIDDFKDNQTTIDELKQAHLINYQSINHTFKTHLNYLKLYCNNILEYKIPKLDDKEIIEIIEKNPHILQKRRILNLIKNGVIDKMSQDKIIEIIKSKPQILKKKEMKELINNQITPKNNQ